MPQSASDANRWIAYELHDGLLQWVIGAKLLTESALAGESSDEKLNQINHFLELAASDGRSLIAFLEQHDVLEQAGVAEQIRRAVESLYSGVADASPTLILELEEEISGSLAPLESWNLYRVAQQAVQNALTHAGASSIKVKLNSMPVGTESRAALQLVIQDDGRGFDVSEARSVSNHFGLSSMEHRAKQIGGSFHVQTAPGQGCKITLDLPLKADEADANPGG